MIKVEELRQVVSWFVESKDTIRDEVIKVGEESKSAKSFDIPRLYDALPMILKTDCGVIASDESRMYDKYVEVTPFAMVCKIIELYRAQAK